MKNSHDCTTPSPQHDKGKNQLVNVRNAFIEPKTMRQVAEEIGEERSSICWYVGMLRDSESIQVYKEVICPTTKRPVNQYTTNKELFKDCDDQLSFFSDEDFI